MAFYEDWGHAGLGLAQDEGQARAVWCDASAPTIRHALRLSMKRVALQISQGDGSALEGAHRLAGRLARLVEDSPQMFLAAVHDHYGRHGVRSHALAVAGLMINLAIELDMPSDQTIELGTAGLLHDIGKLRVPGVILDKPGPLDHDELDRMREHAEDGEIMLDRCGGASAVIRDVCRHHHERLDGSGYPDGLSGEAISRPVRMAMICDVYDALISTRSYKAPWSGEEALTELHRSGGHDAELLAHFEKSLLRC